MYANFWKSKKSIILALACLAAIVFFGKGNFIEKNISVENGATTSSSISSADKDTMCASALNLASKVNGVPQVFKCKLILSNEEGNIIIESGGSGAVTVKRDNRVLLSLTEDEASLEVASNTPSYEQIGSITLKDGAIKIIDVNFDGIPDLQVLSFSAAYNEGYDFWIYDKKIRGYARNSSLLSMINAGFDSRSKTIISFNKGRGLSDYYTKETYRFEEDRYVLIEEEVQDLYDKEPQFAYSNTVTTYKNGVIIDTIMRKLTEEEVMADKMRE